MIQSFLGVAPRYDGTNFIARSAQLIGDVQLGRHSSVWFNATVRGDVHRIRIGEESNIQDNAVIHVTNRIAPTNIGNRVTVGHSAVVHGCTIEEQVLIGIGAVVLDHAVIGRNSLVGARALVTGGTEIPPRSMVLGSPARVVRELTEEEVRRLGEYAANYVRYKDIYLGVETPEENPFYNSE